MFRLERLFISLQVLTLFIMIDDFMYLSSCEHPVRVKQTSSSGKKVFVYVPCGKCQSCINNKASQWIQRLELESQCHAYCLFVTLTYSDKYVPICSYDPLNNALCYTDRNGEMQLFDLFQLPDFKPNSRLYLARRRNIPIVSVADCQMFFKRLRYYISIFFYNNNPNHESEKIRYFLASEYGGTTKRPHYHFLLWFDSRQLSFVIQKFIYQSWQFGFVNVQFVRSSAANYVARYINCVASLPKVYRLRQLRPFALFSKDPSIGSLVSLQGEMSELFFTADPEYVTKRVRQHDYKVSSLPMSYSRHIFPKVTRFNELSYNQRITLYGISRYSGLLGFSNFLSWVQELIGNFDYKDTWLFNYLTKLYESDVSSSNSNYNRLKSLYFTSTRVLAQCVCFEVSLHFYIDRLDLYYYRKDMLKLKKFYELQIDFIQEYKTSLPLIFLYPDVVKFLTSFVLDHSIVSLPPLYRDFLLSFGFNLENDLFFGVDFGEAYRFYKSDLKRLIDTNRNIQINSTKSKRHNDFIESNQSNFNFNLLKDYE